MAERILGMGDMLTLNEKAQENFNAEQMSKCRRKSGVWILPWMILWTR
jgi:signal recognition particle subunit SRP54